MNATFNITLADNYPDYSRPRPTEIEVMPVMVHELMVERCIVPAYLYYEENIIAVPRIPASSSEWYRLSSELSGDVWYALLVILAAAVGVSYLLIQGDRDLAFVILFVLQPLLVSPQSGDFLRWRGRVFFVNWLMFCFILQSSYQCTFLSELTVPSTADAINSLDDLLETLFPIHAALDVGAVTLPFRPTQAEGLMRKVHYVREFDGSFFHMIHYSRSDIAYVIPNILFPLLFFNVSYRVLPGVSINIVEAPFRLNKPSPYASFFETAFIRAIGAGALDKNGRNFRILQYFDIRNLNASGDPFLNRVPKPLTLKSFGVLLVAWCVGCTFAFVSFIFEICIAKSHPVVHLY